MRPEQTHLAARRLGDLAGQLDLWRDTVDEVVLMPVSAGEVGPLSELVEAAIAAWDR